MRKITYKVMPEDGTSKIKSILRQKLGISAAVLTKLKKSPDGILLNGEAAFATKNVKSGDIIEITLKDDNSPNIVPTPMELDIIYEDEDILALNKPRNMPTHPSQNHHDDTLANGVMHYFSGSGFTFRVITRLDKDTSGVVLIAKNKIAASKLSDSMAKGEIQKEYLAICHGTLKDTKGRIDAPIGRKEGSSIMREVHPDGKPSLTQYEVTEKENQLCLVKLNPITGRTHQLRVHLSHIGHPIYGDDMYGSPIEGERCRLHCRAIKFIHPITGENKILEADIPKDFDIIKTRS